MSQHIGSGGAFVGPRGPPQADQTFQALEAEFDAPAQSIEGKDIGRREGLCVERGDEDDPVGRRESTLRYLMSTFASVSPRLAPGGFGRLSRLLNRDEGQLQGRTGLAADPDRPINQPACRSLAEPGKKINQ